jgi:hypothetical protein
VQLLGDRLQILLDLAQGERVGGALVPIGLAGGVVIDEADRVRLSRQSARGSSVTRRMARSLLPGLGVAALLDLQRRLGRSGRGVGGGGRAIHVGVGTGPVMMRRLLSFFVASAPVRAGGGVGGAVGGGRESRRRDARGFGGSWWRGRGGVGGGGRVAGGVCGGWDWLAGVVGAVGV